MSRAEERARWHQFDDELRETLRLMDDLIASLERLDGTEWSLRNDIIGAKFLRVREQLMVQNAVLGEWLLEKQSHESL
jgi:hypothetical protein